MEIIRITKERMEQILPSNIKETDALSENAKRVLATIINYHLVNEKVRTTKFLAINNEDLRQSVGIGKDYLKTSIQELIECKLITRKAGHKWKEGEHKTASEYRLILENLKKPIKKPTSDELLEALFGIPSEPLFTKDSPTNTITNTKLYSTNTLLDCTNTDTTSDTTPTPNTTSNPFLSSSKLEELKEDCEKTFDSNIYFKEFTEDVDKKLVGNEDELLEKRVELTSKLSRKKAKLGSNLYQRCTSYLNRKYEEAIASM